MEALGPGNSNDKDSESKQPNYKLYWIADLIPGGNFTER